ncbi:MAG: AMP-binding protein [Alphaproteobacteria bacterium]
MRRSTSTLTLERIAICEGENSLSYGELDQASSWLATQFYLQGAEPGTRIAYLGQSLLQRVVAYLACMKAGTAIIPFDLSAPLQTHQDIVANAELKFAMLDGPDAGGVAAKLGLTIINLADAPLATRDIPPFARSPPFSDCS